MEYSFLENGRSKKNPLKPEERQRHKRSSDVSYSFPRSNQDKFPCSEPKENENDKKDVMKANISFFDQVPPNRPFAFIDRSDPDAKMLVEK